MSIILVVLLKEQGMNNQTCVECGAAVEIRNPAAGAWAAIFGIVCDTCRRKRWYDEDEDDPQYAELPY